MTVAKVLHDIVEVRRQDIRAMGHEMGADIPKARSSSLPVRGKEGFSRHPFVICEIKRSSPSRGSISEHLDPVKQASIYVQSGVNSISVLTEQRRFNGSLEDLMRIKREFPQCSILRKDFLLDNKDVEVSWRAGADAVLLIAAILEPEQLREMYESAEKRGMACLVEVHNARELDTVRRSGIKPQVMGINARDLNNFCVDPLGPLNLRRHIDWPCEVVYESGIFSPEQVALASEGGFTGVLVGEAVVRKPELAAQLGLALKSPESYPASSARFWERVRAVRELRHTGGGGKRPLVKICGITRRSDAVKAVELGADMIGLVFAGSPRRADIALLRELSDLPVLKIAVVTEIPSEDLANAARSGLIDAFQYHGRETPAACLERGLPFYKALSLRREGDAAMIMDYPSPRVLIDAYSPDSAGGTGKRIDDGIVRAATLQKPLWLAGGLGPDNIRNVIRDFAPELVDASSGLESAPGVKDHTLLTRYFEEMGRADI